MKKLISLIVRRGLTLFPPAVSNKFRLLLHILFEAWVVPPKYPHSNNFKNKIPPDWRRRLPGVDPQSIREIEEFFRRIENDLLIWNNELILRFAVRADCIASEFLVPPENEELECLRRRYHLNGGFESLAALHGVAFLPKSVHFGLKDKAIADIGAYIGNYTIPFILNYAPAMVYSIEPNRKSTEILRQNLRRNHIPEEKCEILNFAVGRENKVIRFDDGGIRMDIPGSCEVQMRTLDDLLYDKNVPLGLIKADIEGMGAEMLAGARRIIERDHPVLALSSYHTPEELFGQFDFLKKEFPFYRISFTALPPGSGWELTMLAVPEA